MTIFIVEDFEGLLYDCTDAKPNLSLKVSRRGAARPTNSEASLNLIATGGQLSFSNRDPQIFDIPLSLSIFHVAAHCRGRLNTISRRSRL